MSKNILLIQFSSRKQGNCSAISAQIAAHYAADTVAQFSADEKVVQPCNNCNYECLLPGKLCPNLNDAHNQLMDAICKADLVYFIIPNYCGYPSANYFAFNERAVGYFNMDRSLMRKYMDIPKRFVIVSNTEGPNFESALNQQVNGTPDIIYMKTGKYHKQSIAGDMMNAGDAQADLKAFLECYKF